MSYNEADTRAKLIDPAIHRRGWLEDFIRRDLKVSRLTATKYLDQLTDGGFLRKQKIGRSNYYVNLALFRILTGEAMRNGER